MRANKRWMIGIILSFAVLITACASDDSTNAQKSVGLEVSGMSSGLGAVDENLDKTKISYSIPLSNNSSKDRYIKWIEPTLGEKVKDRLLSEEIKVNVQKIIKGNQYLEIEGEIILDTKGMTKQEITELTPFITGIKIESQEMIEFDWHKEKKK